MRVTVPQCSTLNVPASNMHDKDTTIMQDWAYSLGTLDTRM